MDAIAGMMFKSKMESAKSDYLGMENEDDRERRREQEGNMRAKQQEWAKQDAERDARIAERRHKNDAKREKFRKKYKIGETDPLVDKKRAKYNSQSGRRQKSSSSCDCCIIC
jgi:hypothetical protein